MHYTEHIIFCNQLRRENDQLRQSHPLRMAFYYTKNKKIEKILNFEKGDVPLFLGITSQGNIFIRMNDNGGFVQLFRFYSGFISNLEVKTLVI